MNTEITSAMEYASSLIDVHYIWWKENEPNLENLFYVNWLPDFETINKRGVNCAGFINLVRQSIGRKIRKPVGEIGRMYPGGTGYWYELLRHDGVLEKYVEGKKYPIGTLFLRTFRDEQDQGHVAIQYDDQQHIIHAFDESPEFNGVKVTRLGYIPDYYEYAIHPENWLLN